MILQIDMDDSDVSVCGNIDYISRRKISFYFKQLLRLIMMAGHVAVVVTPMRADLGPRTGRRPVISQVTLVWFPSNTSS